ncbi:hypothetical protein FSP39_018889 [Pinctada imbricata]|uniref:UBC core domain-containing protein n=1 Tax=Pinctada imbricata TaxID=66713 RepID=A0AA89BXL8_PINIB|nr:hypothetical protein FSP39_018889 [Pinctada imbricata]
MMEMTTEANANIADILTSEFEHWQEKDSSELIFLLESKLNNEESQSILILLLACEHEFKLHVPQDEDIAPGVGIFKIISNDKANVEMIRAVSLYKDNRERKTTKSSEKRWAQKEAEIREQMKKAKLSQCQWQSQASGGASGSDSKTSTQIFTSNAATGILTNDLVRIMEIEDDKGFTAEPIDDNIYHWRVQIYNFDPSSEVATDLKGIKEKFGYDYIELEMTFEIDLYPFYPPLVKVMRPRLQGSMMQRVTNMEMLKLSYWSPTKDMKSVILEIKSFLQQWARLEVDSERNDLKRYPHGAYLEMEHFLLTLALVSEVVPRVNMKYSLDVEKIAELKSVPFSKDKFAKDKDKEYWARGTGYGHQNRPEWDINAYIAAQKEKDNKVENVLHQILEELKILYANHAPQLKPRSTTAGGGASPQEPDTGQNDSVDLVYDMYTVLEGSALIPFIEQYLRADSFLEICRHSEVYRVIVDIIKELARQRQFLPLLCSLPNQSMSLYQLLEQIEVKASLLLKHLCKAGNGSVPKNQMVKVSHTDTSESSFTLIQNCFRGCRSSPSTLGSPTTTDTEVAEEKLAKEFAQLFNTVKDMLDLHGLLDSSSSASSLSSISCDNTSIKEVKIETDKISMMENHYKQALQPLQFASATIPIEGTFAHHYASQFKTAPNMGQKQIFRVAQELSSLSTSLPLDLSSSIFVRSDDEKLTLMRALIVGPEGTPYSGGCFLFDIFFTPTYPRTPPQVNLQTTGSGKVRFNPNLYACGKVCLSLLGTWEGQKGEQWNEKTSTVLQVLVSIQSLILVPDPYFNEPGFEQEIGTDSGKKHSDEYNEDVCYNNIKYAMIGQIQSPPPEFADVIKAHFYHKKQKILEEVDGWVKKHNNRRLERIAQNLKQELKKLHAPVISTDPT